MEKTNVFFEQLLGIKRPWSIIRVTKDTALKRVDLYVEHDQGVRFPCPVCEALCPVYDHAPEREFRHLPIFQMASYLHLRIPRIQCPTHGVQQIVHGLAGPNATVSYELERMILEMEQECSLESVTRILGVDWHLCQELQERAVERGLLRKPAGIPKRIGVDEKSFAKGHKYETLVYNIDAGTVEYVCDNREQSSLESYYRRFTKEELASVEAIAMDMWDPFIAATKAFIPQANRKIVFDRYHIMRLIVKAVDDVRKQEHQALMEGNVNVLKGTKYFWLWNEENVPEYHREEFEWLRSLDLKVCRARAIKENFRNLWNYATPGWMRHFFHDWFQWAVRSKLQPIIKAARTIKAHFENIATYAIHRITNALGESLNSKIEKVKRIACGYRNRAHYRIAIYFHCGGLDLFPKRTAIPLQVIAP